ncbi:MAG: type II/IV secretion system ATPase subunit [Candidatus Methanomethylicaceae archaeon]
MKFRIKKNVNKKIVYSPKSQQKLLWETYRKIDSGELKRPYRFHIVNYPKFDVLEEYKVSIVPVIIGKRGGEGLYLIHEPMISPQKEAVVSYAYNSLINSLSYEDIEDIKNERKEAREIITEHIMNAGNMLGISINEEELNALVYYIIRDLFYYGIITIPMWDPNIEDISCLGSNYPIMVMHRKYGNLGWLLVNVKFWDEEHLADFIRRMAHLGGKGISTAVPYADFILPDGSRMIATLGSEISRVGSTFTIRKFPKEPLSLPQLVKDGMLSSLMGAYLWEVIEKKRIIFVAGPTASGKTTLSNALLGMLDPKLKFVTIEDTPEIRIPTWRWLPHITRRSYSIALGEKFDVDLEDLMMIAMRERPDYLIVGEVRSPEQLITFVETATTGHGGCTTIHANDPQTLLIRLKGMKLESSALDLLWGAVITQYWGKGLRKVRRVTHVAEIVPPEEIGREAGYVNVFEWKEAEDKFYPDNIDELFNISKKLNSIYNAKEEIEEKKKVIENCIRLGFLKFRTVSIIAKLFYTKRIETQEALEKGKIEELIKEEEKKEASYIG